MYTSNKARSFVAVAASLSLLAGCSGGSGGQVEKQPGDASASKEAPTEISIMVTFNSTEPPNDQNVILKEIEKRTNTKLKITWVSPNNYDDKVSVSLASGDIPDLLSVQDVFAPQVVTMAQQGAFWDLTDIIKQYPLMSSGLKEALEFTKMSDGKNYGVPRLTASLGSSFPIIRKDWLDKLGLPIPKTMDDIYQVMKAFAEKDPDGNGKRDTYGALVNVEAEDLGYFSWPEEVFNKNKGNWKVVDGKLVNINLLPGTRQSLEFMHQAYVDKLVPEDFSIIKRSQLKDMEAAGKGGIMKDQGIGAWRATEVLRKTVPQAEFLPLVDIDGYSPKDMPYLGMFVIPKKVPEAKLKKIMEFLEYGMTPEGSILANYGTENVHYKKDGELFITTEQAVKDNVSPQAFGQIFRLQDPYSRAYAPGIPKDMYEKYKTVLQEKEKFNFVDVSVGLKSDTAIKVGPEFNKKITDLKTQIILGKKTITEWDAFVEQLKKDSNFIKMTEELNESYKKRISNK